jgi:hypothetical protein
MHRQCRRRRLQKVAHIVDHVSEDIDNFLPEQIGRVDVIVGVVSRIPRDVGIARTKAQRVFPDECAGFLTVPAGSVVIPPCVFIQIPTGERKAVVHRAVGFRHYVALQRLPSRMS